MKVHLVLLLFLFSFAGEVFGLDRESATTNFRTLWPALTKLELRSGNILLVDPKLISDQGSIEHSSVKFLDGKDYTKLFIRHPTSKGNMYLGFSHNYGFSMLGYSMSINEGFDAAMEASLFCIPGNGSIYVVQFIRGTENRLYYTRKFSIDYDQISEVSQSIIALNLESPANEDLDVFSDPGLVDKVATVAKGGNVTVIGIEYQKHYVELYPMVKVLVTTKSGITGWMANRIVKSEHQFHTTTLEVFNFNTLSGP